VENFLLENKNKNKNKNINININKIYNINEFFEQIYIAEVFLIFKKIYFNIKIDERGRQYKIEYPLNFMSNKLLRCLFNFSYYKELNLAEKIDNINIYKNLLKDLLNKDKKSENYNIFNLLKNPLSCMVGLDAVTQIYQLQSAQLINLNLLEITKVINRSNYNYDLYTLLQKKLINELNTNKNKQEIEVLLENKKNSLEIYINYLRITKRKELLLIVKIENEYNNFIVFGNLLYNIDRSLIKSIIMTYGYNKSIIEIIKDTEKLLFKSNYNIKLSNNVLKWNRKITTIIIKVLLNIFNNEYKGLKSLRLLFSTLGCLSNYLSEPIYINVSSKNDLNSFYQYYYIEKFIKIQKWFTYPKLLQQK
jgi:hypothetical protein